MTNAEFIEQHLHDDVRKLALKMPKEVDASWCLQQIEGYQIAEKKLPLWTQNKGLLFPVKLSMEQCSSEETAKFKAKIISDYRLCMQGYGDKDIFVDLTGGFGVDFSYIALLFRKAIYVERDAELCGLARHNFPLLGLNSVEIREESSPELKTFGDKTIVFIDPARRDNAGRKVAGLRDCSPDVTTIVPQLLQQGAQVIMKLSPMLDIKEALRDLPGQWHIYAVSVKGECRELLLFSATEQRIHAVNIVNGEICDYCPETFSCLNIATVIDREKLLFEPNASILKAGVQDFLCQTHSMDKLHPQSNLFLISKDVPALAECKALGRVFAIDSVSGFSKGELKTMLADVTKANITVRNFPIPVSELRKKLKLKDGGDCYLFATTQFDGKHILIRCHHIQ